MSCGCAFDDMMTGVNGTLAKTNQALSGDAPNSNIKKAHGIPDNSVDCVNWVKKAHEWDTVGKNKLYSQNPKEHIRIEDEKRKDISKIKYNILYFGCKYDDPDAFSNPNKDYVDAIKIEEVTKKISQQKGLKK
jgi:hypothetical protein